MLDKQLGEKQGTMFLHMIIAERYLHAEMERSTNSHSGGMDGEMELVK